MAHVHVLNLLNYGPIEYMRIDALQRDLHDRVARLEAPDTLIVWESQPTYTAGRRTQPQDIPDSHIPVIAMDRGGSVTFHGPGQLVVYPIVKVKPPKDVVSFVRNTELAIGRAMKHFGVVTQQIEGRSGAWIVREGQIDRKLVAIGIKFADDATMHGMALNVTTSIEDFMRVVPCGLDDAGVASLQNEGVETTLGEVEAILVPELARTYAQFLIPERIEAELTYDDAAAALARIDHLSASLPAKTGVAWKPPTTKETN
ncbi:MAG: lipoyl(octanoyl) transferase LipB [Actinomycetaceae bacterium]|nr:lipoyl(octanoyl) transferase LipB [Arcanobacterium sp.]MDD7504807.1 lipoyl(octanoyl) transferase LipB [Actinomycetaceae bacterium]MDY6142664.1 lipoyl(octanoyl) transferase LipB [Arcanobacterium sp.]